MKVEIKESIKVGDKVFKAPVLFYETWPEVFKDANEVDALKKFNAFLHAHGSAADLRDLILGITEELSKVKPLEKDTGRKDSKNKAIMKQEDPLPFATRVIGKDPALFDKVQAILDQRARGYTYKDEAGAEQKVEALRVDVRLRPHPQKGPKKLADKWKELATAFISGGKSLEKFNKALKAAALNEFVFDATVPKTDPKNIEALGWLCKDYQDAQDAFKNM